MEGGHSHVSGANHATSLGSSNFLYSSRVYHSTLSYRLCIRCLFIGHCSHFMLPEAFQVGNLSSEDGAVNSLCYIFNRLQHFILLFESHLPERRLKIIAFSC